MSTNEVFTRERYELGPVKEFLVSVQQATETKPETGLSSLSDRSHVNA